MDLNRSVLLDYIKKNPDTMKEVYKQENPILLDEFFNDIYERRLKSEPNTKSCRIIENKKIIINEIKVAILLDRFIFPKIDKVYLGNSKTHGRGVFAAKDIKAGELLTFYSADIVIIKTNVYNGEGKEICISRLSKRFVDKFANNKKYIDACISDQDYRFIINEKWAIVGHISSDDDTNFLGHFINDGIIGDVSTMTEYEYNIRCLMNVNCEPIIFKRGLCVGYLALKNISKDEEITTHYGFDYWKQKKQ